MYAVLADMWFWLKPCPRCGAAQLLEQQDGGFSRSCDACSHAPSASERRALNQRKLDDSSQPTGLTAARR